MPSVPQETEKDLCFRKGISTTCFAQLLLATLLTFCFLSLNFLTEHPFEEHVPDCFPVRQTLLPQLVVSWHNDFVITCSCCHAVFIIHEKNLVSRIDDWIYQIFSDSCVWLNNSGLNNCCVLWKFTTSVMHRFFKANTAFLDWRATLTSWVLVNILDVFWFVVQQDTEPPAWTVLEALIC